MPIHYILEREALLLFKTERNVLETAHIRALVSREVGATVTRHVLPILHLQKHLEQRCCLHGRTGCALFPSIDLSRARHDQTKGSR